MPITISERAFLFFFLISLPVFSQSGSASLIKKLDGFSHPESVLANKADDVLYVSNIGGDLKDDGFISKVSPDGTMIEQKWVTGLNDPKGMWLLGDKLYVTDNTELIEIDINSKRITRKIHAIGAQNLNDITADNAGNVYVSDTGNSSIYELERNNSRLSVWMSSKDLKNPNGLITSGGNIFIAAWGENGDGDLLKVGLESKRIEEITTNGLGNLDGIQRIGDEFLVSDWATGNVYRIDRDGNVTQVLTSEQSSGDILYFDTKNYVILPMNKQNSVWWYQLN